jgi:large subunit ribosomal protein L18
MAKMNPKLKSRLRRKKHIRKNVYGSSSRPRLSVFRSTKHMYAQIIDDSTGSTLAAASTLSKEFGENYGGNKDAAVKVGAMIADLAKEKGIDTVVFDRNGFLFHGRVKALADSAREKGLKF